MATPRTPELLDRAAGTVIGSAVGDALGAPYEFRGTPPTHATYADGGLGGMLAGEWTDDTAQAVPILLAAQNGLDLRDPAALDVIAQGWLDWYVQDGRGIGTHTAAVFRRVMPRGRGYDLFAAGHPAETIRRAALAQHEVTGHTAGNGALMRTGPVALAYLDDPQGCAEAARTIAELTHTDPLAGDSCVIWSEAIRRAVLGEGFAGVGDGIDLLPGDRRAWWRERFEKAVYDRPGSHGRNGFTVAALLDAVAAITSTLGEGDGAGHLAAALDAVIAAGGDTDTTAAIAGALLGAAYGAGAVPVGLVEKCHGWPSTDADALGEYARRVVLAR